jgi:hypothetical protein
MPTGSSGLRPSGFRTRVITLYNAVVDLVCTTEALVHAANARLGVHRTDKKWPFMRRSKR